MSVTPTPGDTMQTKGNIAARAGRWSTQHRKTAIFGWLAFVIISFGLGAGGAKQLDQSKQGVGESGRASEIISAAFPQDDAAASEQVLVQTKDGRTNVNDPQVKAAVADVVSRLKGVEYVQQVKSP